MARLPRARAPVVSSPWTGRGPSATGGTLRAPGPAEKGASATMAEVVSIHRAGERDAPAQSLTSATVRTDFGLEGDFRSQRAGRHVTLIEEETLAAVGERLGKTIPS